MHTNMKKIILFSLILLCCQSVFSKAVKEGDNPMFIKELIDRMKSELEKDEDNYPALLAEAESRARSDKNPAFAAILHSLTAEMYHSFYTRRQWVISQRTSLSGYIPEDINEWTENLFMEKIKEELELSLSPAELLQKTPIADFYPILKKGEDDYLRPTLYDFLIYRALEIQPSDDLYTRLLSFKKVAGDTKGLVLAELEYANYKNQQRPSTKEENQYRILLDNLYAQHKESETSVEIQIARMHFMESQMYRSNNEDSIRGLIHSLCNTTISRFPQAGRINILRNKLKELENSLVAIKGANTIYPGKDFPVDLTYRNIKNVTVSIYKSRKDPLSVNYYDLTTRDNEANTRGELLQKRILSLPTHNAYLSKDTTLTFNLTEPGLYECVITCDNEHLSTNRLFTVSRLAAVSRILPKGNGEVLVTDFLSGKPIKDATVTYYTGRQGTYSEAGSVMTDKDGLAIIPQDSRINAYRAVLKEDHYTIPSSIRLTPTTVSSERDKERLHLFTDRGIYRPGQVVFVKGIAFSSDKDNAHILPNKAITVILRDANYKEIATRTFTTNDFGSFNSEFTLPKQLLNGWFTLSAGNETVHFQVEEYKRPTFSVEITPITEEAAFGDEITITGKAQTFSGASIYEGEINYRIIRRPFWYRSFYTNYREEQVAFGATKIAEDGTYRFSFRPEKDDNSVRTFQSYEIIVSLSDTKGETQEARSHLSVGDLSYLLSLSLRQQENKEKVNAIVAARTLNNAPIQTTGNYSIISLPDKKEGEGQTVATGEFTTGKPIDPTVFSRLTSGQYRIKLTARDSKGRLIEEEQDIILYGDKDKRPPIFSDIWTTTGHYIYCAPGEEATFVFGTSHKEAYVLYELYANGKNIARNRLVMTDENRVFSFPFTESHGDGVVAVMTFVKEGKLHTTNFRIMKKSPDRTLTVKKETFRDKLIPGNRESWKLQVLGNDSLPVSAEVLAAMYDASLDKISTFGWYFNLGYSPMLQSPYFSSWAGFGDNHQSKYEQPNYERVPAFSFSRLEIPSLPVYMFMTRNSSQRQMSGVVSEAMVEEGIEITAQEDAAPKAAASGFDSSADGGQSPEVPPISIRRDFNETAFFQPTLRTDKDGHFVIDFSLPESNTTWKLQAFAHTAEMKYGLLTDFVISSKPLMVLPNLPRFVRKGDMASISTQIINQSEETIKGRAHIEFFNPANNEVIANLATSENPFELAAGKQSVVNWTMPVPDNYDLIGIRVIAETETASDGEQHILPVLSNEILITESTPFYLTDEKEKVILPPENKNKNLRSHTQTLELSSNPIWYAVQALSTQSVPQNKDILSWFASYYSNTLVTTIVEANPRLRTVIDAWAAQEGSPDLVSNLEKNEELKSILLEETPWVLEAENETERKQRLSMLFNQNRAKTQREAALQELVSQQREDGSWGWYKGFYPDRYMTQSILRGMAQLVELNAVEFSQQEREMLIKALRYLDNVTRKEYEQILRKEAVVLTALQLDYLFIRSYYRDIPEQAEAREAIRFYTSLAEKNWEKASLHGKAQTALLMHRNGNKKLSTDIMNWFKRTATTTEKDGMYWANNRRTAFSSLSPVETHVLLMGAFQEITNENTHTDRMKQWLLNQKRTQDWETNTATLNAVYALLLTGSDWVGNDNYCIVNWGEQTIDTRKDGAIATGYVKETRIAEKITPVTVRKEGNAPAWGAFYHSYYSPINDVTKNKGELSVERTLFVESNTDNGRQITPLAKGQSLHVGDKVVVRLTIRTQQEMTYVHLKDLRAGCFEPAEQTSRTLYRDGLSYYQTAKDTSEQFFFDRLPKGTFVLEYPVYVSRPGIYSSGLSTIQCLYAPEYVSNTEGGQIEVSGTN